MRIIVNDSSALIDLKKGGLLELLVELSFEFVVSDALLADELLSFTENEVAFMRRRMTVASLNGSEMERVVEIQSSAPALSFHDCVSLLIAMREKDCILLTGDKRLRAKAEREKVECHGVLWIVSELAKTKLASAQVLLQALETWKDDSTVRLPAGEIVKAISHIKAGLP